jgi:hypothetical protein
MEKVVSNNILLINRSYDKLASLYSSKNDTSYSDYDEEISNASDCLIDEHIKAITNSLYIIQKIINDLNKVYPGKININSFHELKRCFIERPIPIQDLQEKKKFFSWLKYQIKVTFIEKKFKN